MASNVTIFRFTQNFNNLTSLLKFHFSTLCFHVSKGHFRRTQVGNVVRLLSYNNMCFSVDIIQAEYIFKAFKIDPKNKTYFSD